MAYWLLKSDPEAYSWEDLKKEKRTSWDGVRNYQARNNIKLMEYGDIALFYHSNIGKDIVGQVKITKEAYNDPTIEDTRWFSVEIEFDKEFVTPVNLESIKINPILSNIALIKQSRLSVMPISNEEYNEILRLSQESKP